MKKLLKDYEFNSDMQYFEMIAESLVNGQITQAKAQFKALPKENKKAFLKSLFGYWDSGISDENKLMFIEL